MQYASKNAKCPFYNSDKNKQTISCEGVETGTTIHVAFDTVAHLKQYKKAYCNSRYMGCRIAVMLNDKYL